MHRVNPNDGRDSPLATTHYKPNMSLNHFMKSLPCLLIIAFLPLASADDPINPAKAYETHCAACHAVDRALVGPSLIEIAGIYREDVDGFIKWSIKPQQKRPGSIQMPSMAHVGRPTLEKIHGYILKAVEGKAEIKKQKGDPYGVPVEYVRRPQVQRIFLPDASPAAIAVTLPGTQSYAYDAGPSRLRYVWKGGFIDGYPYWKGNGSSLAKIDGKIIYRESTFPLRWPSMSKDAKPKFLGYSVDDDGRPTFIHRRDGITISLTIEPLDDDSGIRRTFVLKPAPSGAVTLADAPELENATLKTTESNSSSLTTTLSQSWK